MKDLLSIAQKLSSQPYLGEVEAVDSLEQDVSPRKYYRVKYSSGEFPSAILMELAEGYGPMGGGSKKVTQSDAFVEIRNVFQKHGLRVPQLFGDGRSDGFLLLEDFGVKPLWRYLTQLHEDKADPIIGKKTVSEWESVTKGILSLLNQIQSLPQEGEGVIYERKPTIEQLRKGPREIVDFVFIPAKIRKAEKEICYQFVDQLAEEVLSHPKVVSHYDLISHNVFVLENSELGLIDFQDACLESSSRDLHSILCDRGMDEILGEETSQSLFREYFQGQSDPAGAQERYFEYAVHWDMRVAGRFTKLSEIDGREKYGAWIDGTLRRLFFNFPKLTQKFERAGDCIEIGESLLKTH